MPVTTVMLSNLESGIISEVEPVRDSVKLNRVDQSVESFVIEYEVSVRYLRWILSKPSGRELLILLWPYPFASALAVRF